MKTIERSNMFTNLKWKTNENSDNIHHNEIFGYSCSFPKAWTIDTSFSHQWTAQFLGGNMEIAIFTDTTRANVTQYITSILSLYGSNTTLLEQLNTTLAHINATRLQMATTNNEKVIYSTYYVLNINQHALLISIDIEERHMVDITLKRLDHVLRSFCFGY